VLPTRASARTGHTVVLTFEWDSRKALTNRRKHGVSFAEAVTVFADPLSLTIADPDHSSEETRFLDVGMSQRRRVVVVAYTERGGRIRIISARPATRKEKRKYEAGQ
jgi:uncharacterized protein